MKITGINRERRKALLNPDFKGDPHPDDMRMSKKPHHWMQEVLYKKDRAIFAVNTAAYEWENLDEQKCA